MGYRAVWWKTSSANAMISELDEYLNTENSGMLKHTFEEPQVQDAKTGM